MKSNFTLRNLPRLSPPAELRTSLQVIASRERQRRLAQMNPGTFSNVFSWRTRASLFFDNVVGAFAVPAAGGVFSAVILFLGFVVPAFPLRVLAGTDVPTTLTTETSLISMGAFGPGDLVTDDTGGNDVVVDVFVDGQGRMMDYVVVAGVGALAHTEIRRRLENALLVSKFAPATTFGQPMPSKVRLWFRSSRIDVKG
jgi:hypothetical protein